MGDLVLVVFAPSFLCKESNAFKKSINCVALRYFAYTPLIIWQIVKICEVMDQFFWKPFWLFPKNFLDFKLDTIKKLATINIKSYNNKSYASVVFSDFEVTFLKEGEDAAFPSIHHCVYWKFNDTLLWLWHIIKVVRH